MKKKEMKIIKPQFPFFEIIIAAGCFGISIMFLISPYFNYKMFVMSVFLISLGVIFLFVIRRIRKTLSYDGNEIIIGNFLFLGRKRFKIGDALGYVITEKVDQFEGFYEEIELHLKDGSKIQFFKIAYINYEELEDLMKQNFELIEIRKFKFGKYIGPIISQMLKISGIIALLVAILKYI
jgi:preprotein translocase subunit SecF